MTAAAYFDRHHTAMRQVTQTEGCKALCYDQQVALLESLIEPGMTVLDVGCGPSLPYTAPARTFVIGLDPSSASLDANRDIDAGILGSAERMSLDDATADLVVCFYSLHHIVGRNDRHTYLMRRRAFEEMQRVLRPGGELLVFEICPHPWAKDAIRLISPRFEACFWTEDQYRAALPHPSDVQTFECSPFVWFPPILSAPWLRIPRFLYPFDAVCIRWRKESV